MDVQRILVTGATGYLGSRLVRKLYEQGYEVHILTRVQSSLALLGDSADKVTVHHIVNNYQHMQTILATIKPQAIFHLAALFLGSHRPEETVALIDSNLRFLVEVLEPAVQVGCKYLINTGTAWQHYKGAPYRPVNLYAATKEAAEKIIDYYVDARDLRTISLHLSDTYGPDDPRPKIIPTLLNLVRNGGHLDMSPGEQKFDFVYVDDVVNAYLVAFEHLMKSEISLHEKFGIFTGQSVSLRELVACLERVFDVHLDISWSNRPYRDREIMDPSNLTPLPGWHAHVVLEQGLHRLQLVN